MGFVSLDTVIVGVIENSARLFGHEEMDGILNYLCENC